MDSANLALCFSPNLVSGSSILEDTQMCAVPGAQSLPHVPKQPTSSGGTTLGTVVQVCIAQYFEIFDEIRDRTATKLNTSQQFATPPSDPPKMSHASARGAQLDDDDSDDAMLVMPIGPTLASVPSPGPPSAWGTKVVGKGHPSTSASPSAWGNASAGQRRKDSSTLSASSSSPRSIISIETAVSGAKGGSIQIGRGANGAGTQRRGSTAGVEAVGITASGFFTSPSSSPTI